MENSDIMQALYDSEINVEVSWFWDAGFDVKLGDPMNGYKAEGCCETWDQVVEQLRDWALEHYPSSVFTERYWSGDVVAHETGRTPRQLAEERAELLEALEQAEYAIRHASGETAGPSGRGFDYENFCVWADHWLVIARAAIKKARGESDE